MPWFATVLLVVVWLVEGGFHIHYISLYIAWGFWGNEMLRDVAHEVVLLLIHLDTSCQHQYPHLMISPDVVSLPLFVMIFLSLFLSWIISVISWVTVTSFLSLSFKTFELKALLQKSKKCCTFHQPSPTASANPATWSPFPTTRPLVKFITTQVTTVFEGVLVFNFVRAFQMSSLSWQESHPEGVPTLDSQWSGGESFSKTM